MSMTYREIAEYIERLPEDKKDRKAKVFNMMYRQLNRVSYFHTGDDEANDEAGSGYPYIEC